MFLDKILAIVLFVCLLVFIAWLDGTWAEVFQIITSKLQGCVEQNGAVWGIKNAAVSVTLGKFLPPKIALGCSMNYYIVVSCIYIYIFMIHTVDDTGETLSMFFIGNGKKKIKLPCTVLAKQDTVVLQVLHVFLAPVASVQSESFSALHSGAKSSPEVERERESMLWSSVASSTLFHISPTPPAVNCQRGTFLPRPPRQVEQSRRHPFSETKIKKTPSGSVKTSKDDRLQ